MANKNANGEYAESMKRQILTYLQGGGELTALKALKMFNCLSLNARVYELRREGYAISSQLIETETKKHVAKYWLNK